MPDVSTCARTSACLSPGNASKASRSTPLISRAIPQASGPVIGPQARVPGPPSGVHCTIAIKNLVLLVRAPDVWPLVFAASCSLMGSPRCGNILSPASRAAQGAASGPRWRHNRRIMSRVGITRPNLLRWWWEGVPCAPARKADGGLVSGNTGSPGWRAGEHRSAEAPCSVDQIERPIASFGLPSFWVLPPRLLIRVAIGAEYHKTAVCIVLI